MTMYRAVDRMTRDITTERFPSFIDGWKWIYRNYEPDHEYSCNEIKFDGVYVIPDGPGHWEGGDWISEAGDNG